MERWMEAETRWPHLATTQHAALALSLGAGLLCSKGWTGCPLGSIQL